MKITTTFEKTAKAYKDKFRYIINQGGTRSGKTYSTLQLLYFIAKWSKKPLIIHVVSHSTPHLKDGAIVDFEHILNSVNENIANIRTQNPNTYKIGQSQIKFIGFDNSGKAHGAKRDILFVNECNYMKYEILHQLFQRTRGAIFLDYNPSAKFWIDTCGILEDKRTQVIHSTFLDNIENLTEDQIKDLRTAQLKHNQELKRGTTGYYYNWWRVYGLGLLGRVSGTIITDWEVSPFPDTDIFGYCIDWGMKDPFTLTKCAVSKRDKQMWVKQEIYSSGLNVNNLLEMLKTKIKNKSKVIVCDNARPDLINMLVLNGYNAVPCLGKKKLATLQLLQSYKLFVTPESTSIQDELYNYKWKDRSGEVPEDGNDHSIDAIGYYLRWFDYSY